MSADTDVRDSDTSPLPARDDGASSDGAVASTWEVVLLAVGLLLVAGLAPLRGLVSAQLLLTLLVLVLPGLLLLRALGQHARSVALLCVPASLAVLLAVGIATSQAGPALGVLRPLRQVPQLIVLEVVGLALLAIVASRSVARWGWSVPRPTLPRLPHPLVLAPLLLPALAFAGARQLNVGMSPVAATVALVLAVLVLALAIWFADRLGDGVVATALGGVSLALLWSFSLRSEVVFGYDIVSEFRKMAITAYTGQWDMLRPNDAYGAMLSVTVLPTQLSELTGISLLQLLSFVYPAIFALAPVIVYFTCRALLPARWALVGAATIVVQANFGQQLPGLARQEIALVLFAAVLYLVVTGARTSARTHYTLMSLFAVGVVVTHYSTTYLAIPILGLSLLVVGVLVLLGRADRSSVVPIAAALAALVVGALLWNVVLTRSAGNVTEAFGSLGDRGFSVLGGGSGGGGVLSSWLQGTVVPNLPARDYEQAIQQYYAAQRSFVTPLPQAADPLYRLSDATASPLSPWVVASAVAAFLTRQVAFLAALIGVIMLLRRKADPGVRAVAALGAGTILVLIALRLSSTLAVSYNQERALLQSLFVLAPAIGWAGYRLSSLRPRWTATAVPVVAVLVVCLQLAGSSSLIALPGGRGGANLSNTSEDHQRYYSRWGEIAGARWLGENTGRQDLVYADRYGSLRILFATGRYDGVLPDLVPSVIDRDSWVYTTSTNLEGTARSQTDGKFGTYAFPERFLDDNFDIVYSNGLSRVYHRFAR